MQLPFRTTCNYIFRNFFLRNLVFAKNIIKYRFKCNHLSQSPRKVEITFAIWSSAETLPVKQFYIETVKLHLGSVIFESITASFIADIWVRLLNWQTHLSDGHKLVNSSVPCGDIWGRWLEVHTKHFSKFFSLLRMNLDEIYF